MSAVITGPSTTVVTTEYSSVVVKGAGGETTVVREPKQSTVVVTRGVSGPPGRQGSPGPAGDAIPVPVGPSPLSGHSAVSCNAAGQLIPADCTDIGQLGAVLGVVTGAYSPGDDAEVKTGFPLEHAGWTWTTGPVYVGTAGQLTQVLPVGALFCQVVGHALSATRVLIDLQPPISIS